MKRKTNLFYTKGIDSKFITFSNYTESLTGNFLSTDTKLYPSRFIALYIKGLNEETKPALIKYLAAYYESKLAVLRDYYSNNRSNVEEHVNPLGYLLDALLRIEGFEQKNDDYEVSYKHSIIENNDVVKFKYISEITEQDYNGTFADTICCIDLKKYVNISSIEKTDDVDDKTVQFETPTTLYGWDEIPEEYSNVKTIQDSIAGINLDEYIKIEDNNYNIDETNDNVFDINSEIEIDGEQIIIIEVAAEFVSDDKSFTEVLDELLHTTTNEKAIKLQEVINEKLSSNEMIIFYENENDHLKDNTVYVYDGSSVNDIDLTKENEYHVTSETTTLNLEIVKSSVDNDSIEFNCIIPLYDIVNINYKSNFNTLEEIAEGEDKSIDITASSENKMYIKDVPLGMWFYTNGDGEIDESDNTKTTAIKLYYDYESGFSQSWSLTISSQFKPFPYSSKMPTDMLTNSDTNAYSTFAQVLASQASMVDEFMKITKLVSGLENHIRNMESQLANLGTSYNIDNIHREFNNFEIEMNNKFNDLKSDILEQMSYLKWHTTV